MKTKANKYIQCYIKTLIVKYLLLQTTQGTIERASEEKDTKETAETTG